MVVLAFGGRVCRRFECRSACQPLRIRVHTTTCTLVVGAPVSCRPYNRPWSWENLCLALLQHQQEVLVAKVGCTACTYPVSTTSRPGASCLCWPTQLPLEAHWLNYHDIEFEAGSSETRGDSTAFCQGKRFLPAREEGRGLSPSASWSPRVGAYGIIVLPCTDGNRRHLYCWDAVIIIAGFYIGTSEAVGSNLEPASENRSCPVGYCSAKSPERCSYRIQLPFNKVLMLNRNVETLSILGGGPDGLAKSGSLDRTDASRGAGEQRPPPLAGFWRLRDGEMGGRSEEGINTRKYARVREKGWRVGIARLVSAPCYQYRCAGSGCKQERGRIVDRWR